MAIKDRTLYTGLILIGQLGFTIGIPIFLGVAFGRFLDQKMNSGPLFLLIFLLLGLGAGIAAAYRLINMTLGGQAVRTGKTGNSSKGGKVKKR